MKFYQSWEGRSCAPERDQWFYARVPGNIQKDYALANNFEDWQYSDNYKQFIPLEDDHWEYRTSLCYAKAEGERVFFVSKGIIYKYDILLNGELLLSHEGMFTGVEVELTDKLTGKEDILTVHIYPHPKSERGTKGTRSEANESCNAPVYYGWDWNPRLLISGIWDETYIETRSSSYIAGCEVLAQLNDELTVGSVSCDFDCELPCKISLYDAEGNKVYEGSDKAFTVDSPELWWCNGQGKPYLYRWVISNGVEERSGHIGFRTLKLVPNPDKLEAKEYPMRRGKAPITVMLNGRIIFAKGSNWVNPELFWGEITADIYETQIKLAKDCHMNILRMWGGAGLPKEDFYEICDREGILVWQEFMLACNEYRGVPHYMKALESEATGIIKKFRHHPCLAFWCGGNELFNLWSGMDDQSYPLRLLNKLCYELDYNRPFLYTSPLFGMAHGGYTFYAENQGGDVFQAFQTSNCTAYTEFGVAAIAQMDTLRDVIPQDEMFPPNPTRSWLAHHGFEAWGEDSWVCPKILERYFGKPQSIEDMVEQSIWLQNEGYRAIYEEARRQWPWCSMALNWCYNEPWKTAAGNNLIAYPSKPRPCYYYVQKALRPTLFSARIPKFDWNSGEELTAEIWLLNDSPEAVRGDVKVSITVGDKIYELGSFEAEAGANSNAEAGKVSLKLPKAQNTDRVILTLMAEDGRESCYELLYRG